MGPIHGSRYPQLATGTNSCAVSDGFAHPSPVAAESVALPLVNTGPGSVIGVPVCVYCGSVESTASFVSVAGGHASAARNVEGTEPAPAPPVCHADSGGSNGALFSHDPSDVRGSVGIQPSWRPSWYDHAGDSGRPETVELPIFQVQKNQFCSAGEG